MRLIAILAALALSTAEAQAQSAQGTPMIGVLTGCSLPDGRTWLPRDGTCYLADAPKIPSCLRPGNPPGCIEWKIDGIPVSELERNWHLLTISYGGTVSLVKDITKHECEFAMHRVKGEPATEEEVAAAQKRRENAWATINPGDIKSAECFQ